MDLKLFEARLKALGAALDRWPEDEAEAALHLLTTSEAAQDLFAQVTAQDIGVFDEPGGDLSPLADRIARNL
ncbi:hypothetical protein DDF62_19155 [Caulobacter radicis]|uniref:hypothetical protein n=1 Tax=Caulobacter radicis TaxID=2172650 RepID=UPI000D5713B8|nr:hypothetical protein [Caulobacter radicis]PVM86275.1 hypothetical protein DDF62_19155 [Caulobacter radicis]